MVYTCPVGILIAFLVWGRHNALTCPSCSPLLTSDTDICVDPDWEAAVKMAELTPLGGAYFCSKTSKCRLCQGDCDTDADCEEGLICYQRNGGENLSGCAGEDGSSKWTLR
jgi:hypothetical protein